MLVGRPSFCMGDHKGCPYGTAAWATTRVAPTAMLVGRPSFCMGDHKDCPYITAAWATTRVAPTVGMVGCGSTHLAPHLLSLHKIGVEQFRHVVDALDDVVR